MKVEQLSIPVEEAETQYREYLALAKQRKEEYIIDMKNLFRYMRKGKAILDLYRSLTKAGLNEDGDPKLAIVRADSKRVQFTKSQTGKGSYQFIGRTNRWGIEYSDGLGAIHIPENTFPRWTPRKNTDGTESTWQVVRDKIGTITPIIPAPIFRTVGAINLKNYHILWEVKKWTPEPPRDPMLLKRLTQNLFVVLGTWDLTPLERAVIRGRLN